MKRLAVHLSLIVSCLPSAAADWSQFRGPDGSSLSVDSRLPLRWSDKENVAWKVELSGRGPSGPIVVGDRVLVTSSDGDDQQYLSVTCFDAAGGKQLWTRTFWATGRTATHPTSSVAAPTPASDGERIFAFYSSNDLVCLDLDGNLLWYRGLAHDFPKAGNDVGMASSPVVVDDTVVVQVENQGDSFAAGIDARDGSTRWRIPRDRRANWASPLAISGGEQGRSVVLLQSPNVGVTAHDPRTGRQLWQYETVCGGIPSPCRSADGLLLSSNGLTKLSLPDPTAAPEFAWDSATLRPGNASPIAYEDRVYTLNSGVLNCGSLEDGKRLWQLRLQGTHWATPVIANGHMYFINEDGVAKIVDITGDEGEVVGEARFEETIQGSPAVSGNAMFVRGDKHLWKIEAPPTR